MRELLGDEKLNYYGSSYGSWLGAWHAKLFPDRVGNMVLDANVDFSATWQDNELLITKATERLFRDVTLPSIARSDARYELGGDAIYAIFGDDVL